jgi:hypothetical protein
VCVCVCQSQPEIIYVVCVCVCVCVSVCVGRLEVESVVWRNCQVELQGENSEELQRGSALLDQGKEEKMGGKMSVLVLINNLN